MKVCSLVILILLSLSACESEEPPTGMPRCEPEGELLIERDLKSGFRLLFEGDSQKARDVFRSILEQEKNHPEALLGVKHAEGVVTKHRGEHAARLTVAERLIPAPMPVNAERYRYEYEWEGHKVREGVKESGKVNIKRPFKVRQDAAGKILAKDDLPQLQRTLDTLVFQDSQTATADEFFYASAVQNASTHFLIDADGRIFQTLDLALEAQHCGLPSISRRSISVTLVNPMVESTKPREERVRSAPLERHGVKVVHWSYTPAQRRSLNKLVAGLLALLPNLSVDLPEDEVGRVLTTVVSKPQEAKGLLGHCHIDLNASDPTVAFPWRELKRYLSSSLEP